MMMTTVNVTWGTCATCGGTLPMVDGDHTHPLLPPSVTDGVCPRSRTAAGRCGCYQDSTVDAWLAQGEGR